MILFGIASHGGIPLERSGGASGRPRGPYGSRLRDLLRQALIGITPLASVPNLVSQSTRGCTASESPSSPSVPDPPHAGTVGKKRLLLAVPGLLTDSLKTVGFLFSKKLHTQWMRKIIGPDFFERKAPVVAKELLGKFLVRKIGKREIALMITETEAYGGPEDMASHARFATSTRNKVMFGPPGVAYVYFTYGMHWLFNIICGEEGYASAVLIRGAGEYVGPARLTKALQIDKKINEVLLSKKNNLWVEDRGIVVSPKQIKKGPRVGINYAGPTWAAKPLRFCLATGATNDEEVGDKRGHS
jgi:DNA-3-methyladenine glycosylase